MEAMPATGPTGGRFASSGRPQTAIFGIIHRLNAIGLGQVHHEVHVTDDGCGGDPQKVGADGAGVYLPRVGVYPVGCGGGDAEDRRSRQKPHSQGRYRQ